MAENDNKWLGGFLLGLLLGVLLCGGVGGSLLFVREQAAVRELQEAHAAALEARARAAEAEALARAERARADAERAKLEAAGKQAPGQ